MIKKQTHMMHGLLTGLAIVIVGLILHVSGQSMKPWSQWVMYIPFLIGLIINAQAYAKANDYYVTFGNVWSSCFKATAIVTLIVLAWGIISLYIFPEMREKGMEIAREKMSENPGMSEEQIEQGLEMSQKFFIPIMIGVMLFTYMFVGAIFSLIAAAVPKKKGDGMPPAELQ